MAPLCMANQCLTLFSVLWWRLYDQLCSAAFLNLNQVGISVSMVEQEQSLSIWKVWLTVGDARKPPKLIHFSSSYKLNYCERREPGGVL